MRSASPDAKTGRLPERRLRRVRSLTALVKTGATTHWMIFISPSGLAYWLASRYWAWQPVL
jgi:hypothetical protein